MRLTTTRPGNVRHQHPHYLSAFHATLRPRRFSSAISTFMYPPLIFFSSSVRFITQNGFPIFTITFILIGVVLGLLLVAFARSRAPKKYGRKQLATDKRAGNSSQSSAWTRQDSAVNPVWDVPSLPMQVPAPVYPPGFRLRRTLTLPIGARTSLPTNIKQVAWSPDGRSLAVVDSANTIYIVNPTSEQVLQKFTHGQRGWGLSSATVCWSLNGEILASGDLEALKIWDTTNGQVISTFNVPAGNIAWSPNGRFLAFSSSRTTIELLDTQTGKFARPLTVSLFVWDDIGQIIHLAWSPDSKRIAILGNDSRAEVLDAKTGERLRVIGYNTLTVQGGQANYYSNLAWSPGESILAWANGPAIQLWDGETGRQIENLEGHTSPVFAISFSSDGSLLASQANDGTVRFWYSKTRKMVAILKDQYVSAWNSPNYSDHALLSFSPNALVLASVNLKATIINILELDLATILNNTISARSVHYTNAKIVLVGDSGTGKSGLALALTGQAFVPTESTHGRHVWTFGSEDARLDDGRSVTREALLWDLAGQPGYRLIHQLHLNEVAVALVLFDARNETDPFAGVYHWHRALKQAQSVQGPSAPPMKKFLVAARMDREGIGVSRARIDKLIQDLGFDGYFETSAKEGWGITELQAAIRTAIAWDRQPLVSSTELFQHIKDFLVAEKEAGRLQSTSGDLYRAFLAQANSSVSGEENLQAQFETCIGRVESRGLIRRLSFGNLILLQPEKLDAYASALVNAVKKEPEGLGSIAEARVLQGNFTMPTDERIQDKEQERLLLLAMVEDLLRYEIALREQADEGPYLVFPSQSTRDNPDLPDPEGQTATFSFEGPVMNIYATLAVRLSHSGFFRKQELWRNATTYVGRAGGTCGLFLHNIGEGRARLTLYFDGTASEETRFHFEQYVETHLKRRSLPDSIKRHRIFVCQVCNSIITDQLVRKRLERGLNWLKCPVCENSVSLLDREERLKSASGSLIQDMDRAADRQRNRETAQTILQGKIKMQDFDVFLCHNSADKPAIKEIGEQLKAQGILPWLDESELRPGFPWQSVLEEQIDKIKAAAVFVGKNGRGPWQDMELYAFLRKFVNREQKCPVIPVILPDCENVPQLPPFLESMTWVDFRKQEPNPLEHLIWGITGERRLL